MTVTPTEPDFGFKGYEICDLAGLCPYDDVEVRSQVAARVQEMLQEAHSAGVDHGIHLSKET